MTKAVESGGGAEVRVSSTMCERTASARAREVHQSCEMKTEIFGDGRKTHEMRRKYLAMT